MASFNGTLNSNEIFSALYNMLISQQVFADNIKGKYETLVDKNRVDGTLYGDTKLYYATDCLRSYEWNGDDDAQYQLKLYRPEDPKVDKITLDKFRQIRLTLDNYLTKRAWGSEDSFAQFTSVMEGWIKQTKDVYDATTYNSFIGTYETREGRQSQTITLPTVANDKEAENRLQAQTIATSIADLITDLNDVSRDFNDYENLRSYSVDDFYFVWNSKFVNKITKLDVPTIFHNDSLIEKFGEFTLPSRYFGNVVEVNSSAAQVADATGSYRSMIEQDVILEKPITFKGKQLKKGDSFHLFAGDAIPDGITVASTSAELVPSYKVDDTIILKIVHKDAAPYMSAFQVATNFFNKIIQNMKECELKWKTSEVPKQKRIRHGTKNHFGNDDPTKRNLKSQ